MCSAGPEAMPAPLPVPTAAGGSATTDSSADSSPPELAVSNAKSSGAVPCAAAEPREYAPTSPCRMSSPPIAARPAGGGHTAV